MKKLMVFAVAFLIASVAHAGFGGGRAGGFSSGRSSFSAGRTSFSSGRTSSFGGYRSSGAPATITRPSYGTSVRGYPTITHNVTTVHTGYGYGGGGFWHGYLLGNMISRPAVYGPGGVIVQPATYSWGWILVDVVMAILVFLFVGVFIVAVLDA